MELNIQLHPKQLQFVSNKCYAPAFIGGYGAGKTVVNCIKALELAFRNPNAPGLIIAPTYRDLRDNNIPIFRGLIEKHKIPYTFMKSDKIIILNWVNSEIRFRSADNTETLKGPSVAWAAIDECTRIEESILGIVTSRLRGLDYKYQQCIWTGTPEGYNWVYERWVEKANDRFQLIQVSTRENPYISSEYIEVLQETHDETEVLQKIEGKFAETAKGLVYGKHFNREKNITDKSPFIDSPDLINRNLPICLTCDFNINPCVWLIFQHNNGMIYVIDEIVGKDTWTEQMIREVKARGYDVAGNGIIVFGDPSGQWGTTATAGKSDYAIMRQAGFVRQNIASKAPAVKDRINAVNAKLRNGKGEHNLLIHSQCKTLIKDLERVHWKKGFKAELDKTNMELTHATDALGYLIHQIYPIVRTKQYQSMRAVDVIGD